MRNLLYILLLMPCLMNGQQWFVKSFDSPEEGLGDILYGVNFKRYGSSASAPMVNLNVPDPMSTGNFGSITHWTSGSSITIQIDSFATGSSWTSAGKTGVQSPSEFEDAATERGFITNRYDDALGMSLAGSSPAVLALFLSFRSKWA